MSARILDRFAELADTYGSLICDVWGVYHDGHRVFPGAAAALAAFRRQGGQVVLLTNAPRPWPSIAEMIARLGGSEDEYDRIVTAGDVARTALVSGCWGTRCRHLGPPRDLGLFAGTEIQGVPLEQAEFVLCTGLFDDARETADDYVPELEAALAQGLPMMCSNPDRYVHRGATRVPCAGVIAERYEELGGDVTYYGKPYSPVYQSVLASLAAAAGGEEIGRVLAIGDGILTDVRGAAAAGIDCLFVSGGMARDEIVHGPDGKPDADSLAVFLARHGANPEATIGRFA